MCTCMYVIEEGEGPPPTQYSVLLKGGGPPPTQYLVLLEEGGPPPTQYSVLPDEWVNHRYMTRSVSYIMMSHIISYMSYI